MNHITAPRCLPLSRAEDEGELPNPETQRERFADRLRKVGVSVQRFIDVHDTAKGTTNHTQRGPDAKQLSGNYGVYGGPGGDSDVVTDPEEFEGDPEEIEDLWLVDVDDYENDGDSVTTDVENDTESAGESTSRSGSSASSGDRPVELNLFNTGGSYADTEFFVQTFDAEAVMIQLDIEKVLRWLETNDIISDAAAIDNPKQWFLTHVHPPSRYSELPQTAETDSPEAISRYCYTLLHSISHSFMHTIGALGSHQKESLVEHLLPRTMTFIIYKRPDTDVSLGGLWTLFEERFETVVANLEDRDDCTFDPVCRHDENGACEDCMFLSTITCQNVNHNLSRSLFFGGPFDGKDHVVGYKDITTADGA